MDILPGQAGSLPYKSNQIAIYILIASDPG
jgi:hypothetical protein